MNVLVIDILGLILIIVGVTLVVKRPGPSGKQAALGQGGDPRVYVRRIGGIMLAAFGLALAMMVTLYHFAAIE